MFNRIGIGAGVVNPDAEFTAPRACQIAAPFNKCPVFVRCRVVEILDKERSRIRIEDGRPAFALSEIHSDAQGPVAPRMASNQFAADRQPIDQYQALVGSTERRQDIGLAEVRRIAQCVVGHVVVGFLVMDLCLHVPLSRITPVAQINQVRVVEVDIHRQGRHAGITGIVPGVIDHQFALIQLVAHAEPEEIPLVVRGLDLDVRAVRLVALIVCPVQVVSGAVVRQRQKHALAVAIVE